MTAHIAQVELKGKDFQRLALEPGRPMLDPACLNAKTVGQWLGRFAAEPEWAGDKVLFHVPAESGGRLSDVAGESVTADDLRRGLRAEVKAIDAKLQQILPRTSAETSMKKLLVEQFQSLTNETTEAEPGTQFLKYRDESGRWRLVWLWGYQRSDRTPIPAAVCPKCANLFLLHEEAKRTCPACKTPLPVKRFPWGRVVAACLLVGLLGGAAYGGWWYMQPRGVIEAQVVRAVDGQPLGGVELFVDGSSRGKTGTDGEFAIASLTPGTHVLKAVLPGYAPSEASVELAAGQETSQKLTLKGDASLAGKVVNGANKSPLPGVTVKVVDAPWTATTDDAGEFRLESVPSGSIRLFASQPGFPDASLTVQLETGKSKDVTLTFEGDARLIGQVLNGANEQPVSGAKVIIEESGLEAATDAKGWFGFPKAPSGKVKLLVSASGFSDVPLEQELVSKQEKTVRVLLTGAAVLAGKVTNAFDRKPLANAEVSVRGTRLIARTNAEGRFMLPGVPGGKVEVGVVAAGFKPETVTAEVALGKETSVDIALKGDTVLAGIVLDAATKKPLPQADVALQGTSTKVKTDNNGEFRLTGLAGKPIKLDVAHPGFTPATIDWKPGDSVGPKLQIALVGDGLITGTVRDATTEAAVSDAEVRLASTGAKTKTDKDGQYRFEGVRSGKVEIVVSAPGYSEMKVPRDVASGKPTEVALTLAGDLTATGQVVDLITGKPVSGATVTLVGAKAGKPTDAEGRFTLEGLRRGRIEVAVAAANYAGVKSARSVPVDEKDPWQIGLGGEAVIAGTVVDEVTGQPLADVEIKVPNTLAKTVTGKDGKFRLEGLFAGPVELDLSAPGFDAARAKVDLKAKEEAKLDAKLTGSALLMGEVADDLGEPVAKAEIELAGTDRKATTDDKGRFQFDKLRAADGELQVSAAGFGVTKVPVKLKAGSPTVLPKVTLSTERSITGTIINAITDTPVAGAKLSIATPERTAVTDASGTFTLDKVPTKPFALAVAAAGFNGEQVQVAPSDKHIHLVISPQLKPGEARFVLMWSGVEDLDAHLFRSQPASDRLHVYHKSPKATNVMLDVDNQNSRGPETITITRAETGRYEFQVHVYQDAKEAEKNPQTIDQSQAVVKVYVYGDKQPRVYKAATTAEAKKPVWYPCGIVVDASGKMAIKSYSPAYTTSLFRPE